MEGAAGRRPLAQARGDDFRSQEKRGEGERPMRWGEGQLEGRTGTKELARAS